MNEESKENKTVLELQYQYFLNYLNILTVTFISILLTVWLSKDIIIEGINTKLVITIACLYLFILFWLVLYDKLKEIERKINEME